MSWRDKLRNPGTAAVALLVLFIASPLDNILIVALVGSVWLGLLLSAILLAYVLYRHRNS